MVLKVKKIMDREFESWYLGLGICNKIVTVCPFAV